ncbi:hypothetical protein [Candidatus Nanohalococcus occultus]|uniref:Uncharacterized protein n=1 Tax=Candidatus Nanohalococcus occultus TaxID=2978047 RepID=A0ABY8CFK2_9ARCH|nr:hypothetical protein SVXNc_1021 [Candidatus Nanohaloarchaeota archaeon SVXNc]
MATGFNELIRLFMEQDVFTGVLPFVLTYVILFLGVKRVPIFDTDDGRGEQFAALVSIVGAFYVARFLIARPFYQQFFIQYFGKFAVGMVGLLGLMTILAFLGLDLGDDNSYFPGPLLILAAVAMAGAAFTSAGGFGPPILTELNVGAIAPIINGLVESGLIWAVVIGGVLLWTLSEGGDDGGGGPPLRRLMLDPSAWTEDWDDD